MKKAIWLRRLVSFHIFLLCIVIFSGLLMWGGRFAEQGDLRYLWLGYQLMLLSICICLRSIANSVVKETPFIYDNVKALQRIGMSLMVLSIIAYFTDKKSNAVILSGVFDIPYSVVIIFTLSLFAFVMAAVFHSAIRLKEEQDLTV